MAEGVGLTRACCAGSNLGIHQVYILPAAGNDIVIDSLPSYHLREQTEKFV